MWKLLRLQLINVKPCTPQTVKESSSANLYFRYQAPSSPAGRSTNSALKQYAMTQLLDYDMIFLNGIHLHLFIYELFID